MQKIVEEPPYKSRYSQPSPHRSNMLDDEYYLEELEGIEMGDGYRRQEEYQDDWDPCKVIDSSCAPENESDQLSHHEYGLLRLLLGRIGI